MSAGFGFSVGDFVAGIKLVGDIVEAFNDGAGAKKNYQSLVFELEELSSALKEIRYVRFDESHNPQKTALERTAKQCEDLIQAFLIQNAKFQKSLGDRPTASRLRRNMHKIQWAISRKAAVDHLRTQILGHTTTINTLLIAIQSSTAASQTDFLQVIRRGTEETQGQVTQTHDMLRAQADTLHKIFGILDGTSLLSKTQGLVTTEAFDMNMRIYRLAIEMQKSQLQSHTPLPAAPTLPPQVEYQRPVSFEDAHGRITPFHVEFINSFEAFQAVMEIRFRYVPGLNKVKSMQYAIKEQSSNRRLDLTAPWDSVFLPGRTVTMSMVFWRPQPSVLACPGCQSLNKELGTGTDVQCSNPKCSIWYERVLEPNASCASLKDASIFPLQSQSCLKNNVPQMSLLYASDKGEDKISQFRRVQVRHTAGHLAVK